MNWCEHTNYFYNKEAYERDWNYCPICGAKKPEELVVGKPDKMKRVKLFLSDRSREYVTRGDMRYILKLMQEDGVI